MTRAFVFPGQGSQSPGMGKALAENFEPARKIFAEVDDALDQKLSQLMFEGPEDELTMTANAQPALMAVSLAALRVLEAESGQTIGELARYVAGHSLGEYSALAAAGAFSVTDAAKLLRIRGKAMQQAVPPGKGAMAALLGLDLEAGLDVAAQAARETGLACQIANDNGGGQVVASGDKAAVEKAIELAKTKGARRAMLLPVSAPFHCALMQPAAQAMAEALASARLESPKPPLVANVLARPVVEPQAIRERLVEQVVGMVRWRESVMWMADEGVTEFIELGSGKVLTGLLKRITPSAIGRSIGAPAEIAAFCQEV